MSRNEILLSVKRLSVSFSTQAGISKPVQDVSFSIKKGKTFALVGESGSGKTVTALSIMRLLPSPHAGIVSGSVLFNHRDLLTLTEKQMREIRGGKIAMIFQEPTTSLNPVQTIGAQIIEAITQHQNKGAGQAQTGAVDTLRRVGIAQPQQRLDDYPHQMSGGMCQRVMSAMAVSCRPQLLIADEPTTALDVTTQARILQLLDDLQAQNSMSILLITHDLAIAAEHADDIGVMYASRIVEIADSRSFFEQPLHPYTQGLLKSLPGLGKAPARLQTIGGGAADPLHFPAGCKFHPRCPMASGNSKCKTIEPELTQVANEHHVACWHADRAQRIDKFKEH